LLTALREGAEFNFVVVSIISQCCNPADGASMKILESAAVSPKNGLKNIKRFFPESFDRILLDPPCSALGLRPKLFIVQDTLEAMEFHAKYQRKFVKEAVALLKPGGVMTYSTCTIHMLENESMVRHILDTYPSLELLPIGDNIGLAGLPGAGLNEKECEYVRRFDPSDEQADTMGFFLAKFRKRPTF
jgi:16S rRNA C967 or C1407 C5-methylase (RsmB/RsmF family)